MRLRTVPVRLVSRRPLLGAKRLYHPTSPGLSDATASPGSSTSSSSTTTFTSFPAESTPSAREVVQRLRHAYLRQRFSYTNHRAYENRWRHILQTLSVFGHVSHGNAVTPYRETGDAYRHMWEVIDKSAESVQWQTYICKDDDVGVVTVEKLKAAQSRGVSTELLYDCGGNITGRSRLTESLKKIGANVIRHRPFFQHMWRYVASGGKWEHSPALRNHRKILIVDHRVAFTGGLNIGNDYCGKEMGGNSRFRDTHCQVVGPAVQDLQWAYNDTIQPRPWRFSFARWRRIVSDTVKREKRLGSVTSTAWRRNAKQIWHFVRMLQLKQQIKSTANGTMEQQPKQGTAVPPSLSSALPSTDGAMPIPKQQRLRWLRQQLLKASTAAASNKENTLLRGIEDETIQKRMHRRWVLLRRAAAAAFETGKQQHYLRQETKFRLEAPLEDTDPVPEAVTIHKSIPSTTQVLSSNPHTRDWSLQVAMWHVTRSAHRRVWITTPYYMPHRKLTQAILHAANRGVDVRIVAGSQTTTDPWFMWYASHYLTERFLRSGVTIYEYDGGQIMHAKTVVVDSVWSSIGSYNWDCMSNKNMEVCLTHFDFDTAKQMEAQFLKDVSLSKQITLDTLAQRPLWKRAFSWFSYHAVLVAEKLTFFTYRDSDLSSKLD